MLRVLSADLWEAIRDLGSSADKKFAAVAYTTSDELLAFGAGDTLVTDASDEAIATGQTSAAVLARALERGARLVSVKGLHAKVMCLGRHAVVGSANLSASSVDRLVEAAIVTDHPIALGEAMTFVLEQVRFGTGIDGDFIQRIARIRVITPTPTGRAAPRQKQPPPSRAWLVGVHLIDERRYENEADLAAEGVEHAAAAAGLDEDAVSWLRFTGTSTFRASARPGDLVIQIWRNSQKAKRARVYAPAPLLFRQDEPSCTRLYVADFTDDESRAISWTQFKSLWREAASDAKEPSLACTRLLRPSVFDRIRAAWPTE